MKIDEAIRAISDEYDLEVALTKINRAFARQMEQALGDEYDEIDRELPGYVAEIAKGMGVKVGTTLPDYVYQVARMCFRMGMRAQRKIDHPNEHTTVLWRANGRPQ